MTWDGTERRKNPGLAEMYRLIEDIHRAMNGNGQPGLIKMVERHDAWLRILGAALFAVSGAVVKILLDSIGPR